MGHSYVASSSTLRVCAATTAADVDTEAFI